MIVKVLRSLCYFNPKTGETRNTIELDMDELADYCGVSRRTIIREFQGNTALACFVTKQSQYVLVGTRARRQDSRYFVAMDDPIHPDDMAEYELLKQEREGRTATPPKTVVHRPASDKCQNGTYQVPNKCHFGTNTGQSVTGSGQIVHVAGQSVTYVPTVESDSSVLLYTSGTAALAPQPNGLPPEGAENSATDPLAATWQKALCVLAGRVNTPTFEAHIRTLRPVSLSEEGEVVLAVPSAFTRGWIEKRNLQDLEQALSDALEQRVRVRLVQAEQEEVKPR